jgi:hypothetical protein
MGRVLVFILQPGFPYYDFSGTIIGNIVPIERVSTYHVTISQGCGPTRVVPPVPSFPDGQPRKELKMILVRLVFQTEWGKAGQVVEGLRQNSEMMRRVVGSNVRVRILTDLSGPFHTVVQEMEYESLAEWERARAATFENAEFQEAQASSDSPFVSGQAEFYTIEMELET